MSPRRRRPPPVGDAGAPASARVDLRIVRVSERLSMGRLAQGMLIPTRRATPGRTAFEIEVVEREGGRVVATRAVTGGEGDAQGLIWMMRDDLGRLDLRGFLRKWVHLQP